MTDDTSLPRSPARPTEPATAGPSWLGSPTHHAWLDAEFERLVRFSPEPRHPAGGFAWLGADGRAQTDQPIHTWITGRMTHVHALAHLRGVPGSGPLVDHGVAALRGLLRDDTHGGWYSQVAADGSPTPGKEGYAHAFVVLAATSAAAAGRAGARELLDDALGVLDEHFWDDDAGRYRESFADDFSDPEPYRGANSNMHLVEAGLAAADVTGDRRWRDRSLAVATHLIDDAARANGWRLIEHYDTAWQPIAEYNADEPAHPFRPYGTTIGHWLEWSRLLLHLDASITADDADDSSPRWLVEAARALFDASVDVGWGADGTDGFVYTLDWHDQPVVDNRLHWVVCEAIATAGALHERTGERRFEAWYRLLWDHAERHFIDRDQGSWHHELSPDLTPATGTWSGKPDLYHAAQACLLPQLDLAPSLATQLAGR